MPFGHYQESTPNILQFFDGQYNLEKNKIIVNKLSFEDRKIIIDAASTSAKSNELFSVIARDIIRYDCTNTFNPSDAVLKSEVTSCVAFLDIDYMRIYSNKLKSFVKNNFAPLLTRKYLGIQPSKMSFIVNFKPDKELLKEKISLAQKTLTIEPKADIGLEKKIFYSMSPFDSDTHLKLLEQFEDIFKV